jgi:hypothetical protein
VLYNQGIKILSLTDLKHKSLHELVVIREEAEAKIYNQDIDVDTWQRLLVYFEKLKREINIRKNEP